ncbi:MAG: hypothetical protein D6739_04045, partial [Nitrospirae bacterium]
MTLRLAALALLLALPLPAAASGSFEVPAPTVSVDPDSFGPRAAGGDGASTLHHEPPATPAGRAGRHETAAAAPTAAGDPHRPT